MAVVRRRRKPPGRAALCPAPPYLAGRRRDLFRPRLPWLAVLCPLPREPGRLRHDRRVQRVGGGFRRVRRQSRADGIEDRNGQDRTQGSAGHRRQTDQIRKLVALQSMATHPQLDRSSERSTWTRLFRDHSPRGNLYFLAVVGLGSFAASLFALGYGGMRKRRSACCRSIRRFSPP